MEGNSLVIEYGILKLSIAYLICLLTAIGSILGNAKPLAMMKSKIGLLVADDHDVELIQNLEENLELVETDMTIFFRKLSDFTNKKEFIWNS